MTMPSRTAPRTVIVIGAGAAGMIAAWRAAECGALVTLLEKNDRLGVKILISGGGKCNITHAGSIPDILAPFRQNERRFLAPSFYRFTNHDILKVLHCHGIESYARPDGRVFPTEPSNAKDVVAALTKHVLRAGVIILTGRSVDGLELDPSGSIRGVRCQGELITGSRVIVACGGSSYPATGTTGDGWRWIKDLGHTTTPLLAALAPIYLDEAKPEWSGVALRDIILRARVKEAGKEIVRWRDDMLFTHRGISGPATLAISREVAEAMSCSSNEKPFVEVDLIPDTSFIDLKTNLTKTIRENPRRLISSLLPGIVPSRLHSPLLQLSGIPSTARGAYISSSQINLLTNSLKCWPLGRVSSVPLERGEVVAGGVTLTELDPHTMQSLIVSGLFLCGEILDIAGPVGGYNLQAAWSTGFVAGEHSTT